MESFDKMDTSYTRQVLEQKCAKPIENDGKSLVWYGATTKTG